MVAGDLVFVGSCNGVFSAYDRETGDVRWSHDTAEDSERAQFHGDPLITEKLVIIGSDSTEPTYTYAFERETGKLVWKQEQDSIESDVLGVGASAVGQIWNGDLVALSLETGELIWKVSPAEHLYSHSRIDSPAQWNGTVTFGGRDGNVYAVDGETGTVLWKTDLKSRISTTPAVGVGGIYVGCEDGRVYRLSLADGRVTAISPFAGQPLGQPVPIGDGLVMLLDEQRLALLDSDLTREVWSRVSDEQWSSLQPLVWQETVIVGDPEGNVHAFRLTDGSTAWMTRVEGRVRGLGAFGDVLYVGVLQGGLTAYLREKDPSQQRGTHD